MSSFSTTAASILLTLLAAHLAFALAVGGLAKAIMPASLRSSLAYDGLIGQRGRLAISRVLPPAEIAVGFWLTTGYSPRIAADAAALLFVIFFGYRFLLFAIRSKTPLKGPCGCFGIWEPLGGRERRVELAASGVNSAVAVALAVGSKWVNTQLMPMRLLGVAVIGIVVVTLQRQLVGPSLRARQVRATQSTAG